MESFSNENEKSSLLQRILIGVGALIVIGLTVVAAVFLTVQDLPEEATPTSVTVVISPPAIVTPTPTRPISTPTQAPLPPDTAVVPTTPAAEAPTVTEVPPTATDTPLPPPPTATPTQVVLVVTATAAPATATPVPVAVGTCQLPPTWVAYTVQTGDTLNSLADRTNRSVFDLQQVNCLESFTILPGDTIYLPFTPPSPTPSPTRAPTGTRRPTPTRTATPINPRIINVVARKTDTEIVVVVQGENFRSREQGFRAELVGPTTIELQLGEARTSTNFEAFAPIPADLPAILPRGAYDLVVINPFGGLDTERGVFPPRDATPTPTPAPPEITRASPASGRISEDVRLTIQGRNFRPLEPGFLVEIRSDDGTLTVDLPVDQSVRPATSTSFDVIVTAGTLTTGTYDLLVTNPNGQTDIERNAYDAIN
jgi:LysM repeat protein